MRTTAVSVIVSRVVVIAALITCVPFMFGETWWSIVNTFQIGGGGAWDYVTVDAENHRLYVPRTTDTMVIDTESGKVLADIPGQKRAHGVALVPRVGRGFISDGGGNGAVVIFDLKTNVVLGTIPAQPDADGIIYDKFSDRVLVVSGDGGVLMTLQPDVDPTKGKIEKTIPLDGAPEFLAADGVGKVYVNLMDKNLVAAVDLKRQKVVTRWPVAPGGAPVGMSMDTEKRRLFIGCRNPQMLIVMNADDGKILAFLPIGSGVDATKFDGAQVFASCRDGKLHVVQETSSGSFDMVQTVQTPAGARTMDIDRSTGTIYLPTVEFEPAKPGARTSPKPDTFMIVVARKGST
jgi:DNA-binding beta-propeller fold protein YncE